MIRGVHHISISTLNFDAMVHFYRDLLGLEFAASYDWGTGHPELDAVVGLKDSATRTMLLKAGNTHVEIFEYLSPKGKPPIPDRPACDAGLTHICFDMVDVMSDYNRLVAAGVNFHTPPVKTGVFLTTYGRDPDSNIFEIQEVLDNTHPVALEHMLPNVAELRSKAKV